MKLKHTGIITKGCHKLSSNYMTKNRRKKQTVNAEEENYMSQDNSKNKYSKQNINIEAV